MRDSIAVYVVHMVRVPSWKKEKFVSISMQRKGEWKNGCDVIATHTHESEICQFLSREFVTKERISECNGVLVLACICYYAYLHGSDARQRC